MKDPGTEFSVHSNKPMNQDRGPSTHSEIRSFYDEMFSYLKFHRASVAFHVAGQHRVPITELTILNKQHTQTNDRTD